MTIIDLARLSRFWTNVKQRIDAKANKTLSDVAADDFAKRSLECQQESIYTASSTDGIAYTANVPGVTQLVTGLRITVVFSRGSASTAPTLNVNGLGAKGIRIPLSFNLTAVSVAGMPTFYTAGKPFTLVFDAEYGSQGIWRAIEKIKTSAQDLYGTVPVSGGGTGANNGAEALENLGAASAAQLAALEARVEALEN